jgi:choice-of-anchor A domain-containing protein
MLVKEEPKMYRRKKRNRRGGFALGLVMCVLILLLVLGAGVVRLGMHGRAIAVRDSSQLMARSAADAGLTQALYSMNQMIDSKTWNDNSLPSVIDAPLMNSTATYSYQVTKIPTADSNDDIYSVKCTGKYGLARKTVYSTLELKGIFEYAIYTLGNLTLKSGTTITAYNHDADDPPLQIGTNSTTAGAITAKTGVTIDGDIVVGPGGDPEVVINNTTEAAITGETYPSITEHKTPYIRVPQTLQDMVSSGIIDTSATISSPAKYDSINLGGATGSDPNKIDKVTVDSNVEIYVTGDLKLGNNEEVIIQPDASLVIYLGGNLYVDNGGAINNLTKDPKKLKIFGLDTCTNIDFKNSGTFWGAVYAPDADIHLYNSFNLYGAVVGKSFLQDMNANFYYDMSLREIDPQEIGVQMVIKRWSEQKP